MSRPLWTGSLSFGLVNVPVQLITGARDVDLHFRQLHERDGAPIETQRWCVQEDREVPYDEIARSYRFDDGARVIVTDEELEALEPRRTRTIEIEQFVDVRDVDPIYFERRYLVAPATDNEGALRAYSLLVKVMERTDRGALGRFVMRAKEYLAIVRAQDGGLALTTMRFADEVRPTTGVDDGSNAAVREAALTQAMRLVDAMTVTWEPGRYKDCYRERLTTLVRRKQQGQTIRAPAPDREQSPVPDLMDALRESLASAMQ